eukprot:3812434-Alexandrium_andersonii.AAC.1
MSASLVGSEMCIRDSACAGGRPPVVQCLCERFHSRSCAHVSVPSRTLVPVSYTHLTLPTNA